MPTRFTHLTAIINHRIRNFTTRNHVIETHENHGHWGEPHDVCTCNHRHHGAAKKAQQNVFALYHSYNRTILLGFIWILYFHFKIVLVLRRRYRIPIRCNNGKRKIWSWRWLHHFDFKHWRWLHALMTMVALFRAGNFWHTHRWSPADTYAYRLYDCCQVWYV